MMRVKRRVAANAEMIDLLKPNNDLLIVISVSCSLATDVTQKGETRVYLLFACLLPD